MLHLTKCAVTTGLMPQQSQMGSVKCLRPRLNSILFKLQFEEQVSHLRPDMLVVSAVCEDVRKSKAFSKLLELVLLMGNYMNAGSRNALCYGFDLSSLCKLKDTKSADQMSTLLHFLAEVCEEKFPDVLKFVDDLQQVDRASRVCSVSYRSSSCQTAFDSSGGRNHVAFGAGTLAIIKFKRRLEERKMLFLMRKERRFQKPLDRCSVMDSSHSTLVMLEASVAITVSTTPLTVSARSDPDSSLSDCWTRATLSNLPNDTHYVLEKGFYEACMSEDAQRGASLGHLQQVVKENGRRREAEEKQRRARAAKEKAEREKQERQQRKKRLLDVNAGKTLKVYRRSLQS
ncbi:protein diaphanous homolog 3 isoform X1 [Tachysurus ichikawai]